MFSHDNCDNMIMFLSKEIFHKVKEGLKLNKRSSKKINGGSRNLLDIIIFILMQLFKNEF